MTGRVLFEARRYLQLTQMGLAQELRVTPNTVARWERGEMPISQTAARLVQILRKHPELLERPPS